MKVIAVNEINNFKVLSFYIEIIKMLENNLQFHQHINNVMKQYLSRTVSSKNNFYIKVVLIDEIALFIDP